MNAALILRLLAAMDSKSTPLQTLAKVFGSVFCTIILLIAMLVHILTSPIEFVGALGEFQLANAGLFNEQLGGVGTSGGLTAAEIAERAAGIADPRRQEIIKTALSLVGKVPYFWGGKSADGWNDDWGKPRKVTAAGVSSTGTIRPFGLDCSGYTDWVYRTAGIGSVLSGGTAQQWRKTEAIKEEELVAGDLVFKNNPAGGGGINHVGIYCGKNDYGENLYLHCSSSGGGVVLNSYSGFRFFRRAPILTVHETGGEPNEAAMLFMPRWERAAV